MKRLLTVLMVQGMVCTPLFAQQYFGGDEGYVLSPLPTRAVTGPAGELIYTAPPARSAPTAPPPVATRPAARVLPLPPPDANSIVSRMTIEPANPPASVVKVNATAPADLSRSKYDRRETESSVENETDMPPVLDIGGSVVVPHVLHGTSATGNRVDSSDPYYSVDVTVRPVRRVQLYGSFWQDELTRPETDELYGTLGLSEDERSTLSYGRIYLPFGSFDTNLLSSPLTEAMGSVHNDQALVLSTENDRFFGNVFLYRGGVLGQRQNRSNRIGLDAGIQGEQGTAGVSWISNIADADAYWPHDVSRNIPGIALYGEYSLGSITLAAEYIQATRALLAGDVDGDITRRVKPSATHVEVGVETPREGSLALSWSATRHADELFQDRRLVGLGYQQRIWRELWGALEVSRRVDEEGVATRLTEAELEYSF